MKSIPRYFRCKPKSRRRQDVQTARTAEKFINYVYHKVRENVLAHVVLYGDAPIPWETLELWLKEAEEKKA